MSKDSAEMIDLMIEMMLTKVIKIENGIPAYLEQQQMTVVVHR